jgi:hypothetical protein
VFGIGVILVVGLPLVGFVVLPNMVNKRIDEAAAKAGFTLTHDPISLSTSGITLEGVVAKNASLPGTSFKASSIDVTWAGDAIAVRGATVTSKDPPAALRQALRTTDGALAAKLEVFDISAEYTLAEDVTLKSTGGKLTLAGSGASRTTTFASPEARLAMKTGALGPYRVDAENGPAASRVRIGLDPAAPDGANVLLAWSGGVLHVGAKIPRAALAGYGVPPELVGLREGDNPDVELELDAEVDTKNVVTGKGKLGLYRAKLGPSPLDVTTELTFDGNSDAVDAKSTKARIGPFPATINAQWRASDKAKVGITFQTLPVSCADLANAKAKSTPIGALLTDLVAYTGAVTVAGKASVKGNVTVALEAPPKVSGKIAESDTCGLLIFSRKL